jgi:signal peptidase
MLLFIGSMAFGLHPMVVISASMEPEITVGSLIVSIETTATSLERGDVITVRRSETRRLVTHRIVEVHGCNDGQCTFTLKGDANIARDPHQVTIDSAPRLLIAVPAVGYGVVWMRSIPGLVVLAVTLVLLAFLVIFAPNSHGKDEQRSEAKPDSE